MQGHFLERIEMPGQPLGYLLVVKWPAVVQIEGMIVASEPLPGCRRSLLAVTAILHLLGGCRLIVLALLNLLLKSGYLPLICPPALSDEGEAINVDGDRAAARIAATIGADKLIILANVPGLLRNENDESTLIEEIDRRNLRGFERFAKGRMKKKLMGAGEALERGV